MWSDVTLRVEGQYLYAHWLSRLPWLHARRRVSNGRGFRKVWQRCTNDRDILARDSSYVIDSIRCIFCIKLGVSEQETWNIDPDRVIYAASLQERNEISLECKVAGRASTREKDDWRLRSVCEAGRDVDGCAQYGCGEGVWCIR